MDRTATLLKAAEEVKPDLMLCAPGEVPRAPQLLALERAHRPRPRSRRAVDPLRDCATEPDDDEMALDLQRQSRWLDRIGVPHDIARGPERRTTHSERPRLPPERSSASSARRSPAAWCRSTPPRRASTSSRRSASTRASSAASTRGRPPAASASWTRHSARSRPRGWKKRGRAGLLAARDRGPAPYGSRTVTAMLSRPHFWGSPVRAPVWYADWSQSFSET